MHELAVVALLLVLDTASLEIRVSGSAGNLGGTLTLPGRGRAPFSAVVTLPASPVSITISSATPSERAKVTTGFPPRSWRPRSWPRCAPGCAPRCVSMAIVSMEG